MLGPSLPLDRFYDERFRRLQKLRHESMRPNPSMKPSASLRCNFSEAVAAPCGGFLVLVRPHMRTRDRQSGLAWIEVVVIVAIFVLTVSLFFRLWYR
jgi:hypothetical protein